MKPENASTHYCIIIIIIYLKWYISLFTMQKTTKRPLYPASKANCVLLRRPKL